MKNANNSGGSDLAEGKTRWCFGAVVDIHAEEVRSGAQSNLINGRDGWWWVVGGGLSMYESWY